MKMRDFGRTGLRVSVLGFGAAPLGGHYGDIDDAGHLAAVRHALDAGVNIIDTSPYYSKTRSETLLGEALSGGVRQRVVLCTKAGRNGRADFDFSAKSMLASLDASLARLRTDYVEVWHAHDIEFATDYSQIFSETAEALHAAKKAGKCRFVGMTGYPPAMLAQVVELCNLDVVLNYCHLSLCNDQMATHLIPTAVKHGVAVCNASALMMGLFASKPPPTWHPAPPALMAACRAAVKFCESRGKSVEVLALQHALMDPRVATTFVGMSSPAEVAMNLSAVESTVNTALIAELHAMLEPVFNAEWPSGNWPVGGPRQQ